ncbi:piwi domain protein, partial [Oesophagostomum dentatum]
TVVFRQRQSCGNFVSKTNLKLGGINYEVVPESFARNRWIAGGKTMIVGYDVAHPGKPTRDEIMNKMPPQKPSVVGFAFNGAVHPEAFIGDYHFQTPRRERVENVVLNARFKWMLELFKKNRNGWPERIVITRDGVSEGQYRMEACEEFGNLNGREGWKPLFTVVVATKRHNARFFVEQDGGVNNPHPATVVDTDVVRNDITEFYMQSHRPVQGTAKPTSYQVIVDENDMSSDEVQSLMLALSFHHQVSY